jgi:DNA-binding NtrC family response regulator
VFCDEKVIKPENLYFKNLNNKQMTKQRQSSVHDDSLFDLPHQSAIREFEIEYFSKLLEVHRWQIKDTAKKAGISREWLSKKLKILGLKNTQA